MLAAMNQNSDALQYFCLHISELNSASKELQAEHTAVELAGVTTTANGGDSEGLDGVPDTGAPLVAHTPKQNLIACKP